MNGPNAVPRVSVCIRACGRPERLRTAIESALGQSFGDFEIVVSDDSGDSQALVTAFDDPRVRYHRHAGAAGSVANLRHVLGLARGELLALLDDDDRWLPGYLGKVVERFDRDPELGVVLTDHWLVAKLRPVRRRLPIDPGRHDAMLSEVLQHPILPSAAVMRRAVWEDGERELPLAPGLAGAATLWIRAAAADWPFYYLDEPLVEYGWHPEQMSWTDETMAARYAATLARFRFADPAAERLRRARLAEAWLTEAHAHLRHGRVREAGRTVRRARTAAPRLPRRRVLLALSGARGPAARFLARHPWLLAAALPAWRRIRPDVR